MYYAGRVMAPSQNSIFSIRNMYYIILYQMISIYFITILYRRIGHKFLKLN